MAIHRTNGVDPPRLLLAVFILTMLGYVVSECPAPPALSGMTSADYNDNQTGSVAVYSCLEGYVHPSLNTSFNLSCNDQGVWEGPDVMCNYVDCRSPPLTANTTVTFDRSSYRGIANYTCQPGYRTTYPGYATATCTANGTWTLPTIDCQVSVCPAPPALSGMTAADYNDNQTGSVAVYSCLEGYVHPSLNTSFNLSCNDQGVWEGPNVTCNYVDCGSPPLTAITTVTFDRSSYRGIANYTCQPGYRTTYPGYATATCTANGTWTLPTIDCQVSVCPAPPALSGMTAADYNDNQTGSVAVYSCLEGYVHPSLNTSFNLSCNDQGVWEGPNVTCNYVDCGSPPLTANTTVTFDRSSYQGIANYTCQLGYSTTYPGYATATCTANGTWTLPTIDCQAIVECGEPPRIKHAFLEFNGSSGYLDQAVYQCHSGHFIYETGVGGHPRFSLTCSLDGQWRGLGANWTYCWRLQTYEDCHIVTDAIALQGSFLTGACRRECSTRNASFAMRKGGECACAETKPLVQVPNAYCNASCDNGDDKLCGGHPDYWSVHSTFHGCFSQIRAYDYFISYNELTCQELCRGRGSSYVAYFPEQEGCTCLNFTQPAAKELATYKCKSIVKAVNNSGQEPTANMVASVSTLELVPSLEASTCQELFKEGVHLHGLFYLKGTVGPTYCNFYDGTADCPLNWLSFNKHCYRFFPESSIDFYQAWSQCIQLDSHLIAVNSRDEDGFMRLVNKSIPAFGSKWRILGMYDQFQVYNHQWLDGSMVTYTRFRDVEPNNRLNQCVHEDLATFDAWFDYGCGTCKADFVCERSLGTYGCVTLPVSSLDPVHTFEDSDVMTLSFCFETCRAWDALYAAVVNGTTCLCLTSLPANHTKVSWSSCSTTCSGNQYQLCGGHPDATAAGDNDLAFVIRDVGQPFPSSCTQMGAQGIRGSQLIVGNNGNTSVVNCTEEASCPYSFSALGGRCYKFLYGRTFGGAKECHKLDSYMVVIDNQEEFINVFNDSQVLRSKSDWVLGLFSYGSGSIYRTSNGRALKGLDWVPDQPARLRCVKYDTRVQSVAFDDCYSFNVCEKGPEYRGCGVVEESASTLVLSVYPEMSVIQCVELCRGRGDRFALIANLPYRCYCANEEPQFVNGSECDQYCFHKKQVCGGQEPSLASVYSVDDLPALADSCSDLFDMDVMAPGVYLVNGTPAYCYMKDNSSCSLPNTDEWEGVAQDGVCFKWSLIDFIAIPSAKLCEGASNYSDVLHLPASIRSLREKELLRDVSSTLKDFHQNYEARLGGLDQFLMGVFTWADGWLMTLPASAWAPGYPILNYGQPGKPVDRGYMSLDYLGLLVNNNITTVERKVVCREITDDLGCVLNPSTLPAVISNYSSMSIALCKQTCLAQPALVALLDTGSCYCSDDTDLSGFVAAAAGCNVSCPGNILQHCGEPGFLRAYRLNTSDVADSCETLYANFVVLNNTYILRDVHAPDANFTVSATCGLSDATSCPAGFLGNEGSCYRFFPRTYIERWQAAADCFSFGGYLATPTDASELTYLLTAVTRIPSLSNFTEWQLGVLDYIQGQLLASSDGSLLVSPMWDTAQLSAPGTCMTLDVTATTVARGRCNTTLPFVCEIGPEFVGCRSFLIPPGDVNSTKAFDLSTTSVTVQQCLALCFGQGRRYALITTTTCYCGNADVIDVMQSDVKACPSRCDGYYTQACGTSASGIYAVYDADAYSVSRKAARSCSQYRQVLVTAKGQYYLLHNDTTTLLVNCGTYGWGHDDILSLEVSTTSYTATSSTADQARLDTEALAWTSWRPDENDSDPWVQVTLSDYYIIKAIVFTGSASNYGGHVTELAVSYGFETYNMEALESTLTGPSRRSALAVRYLSLPVVAKVVKLQPVTWSVDSSLSFTLLGQRYVNFSHVDRYIGCFADPSGTALVSLVTGVTEDGCKDHCSLLGYLLFGAVTASGVERCGCASAIGEHGELDVTSCNSSCGGLPCGNDAAMSVAVFRAYDKRCGDPPVVTNATATLTSLVAAPGGVYGTGSNVTYTCPANYRLMDMMLSSFTITCLQNNTWAPAPPDACQTWVCGIPPDVPNCQEMYAGVTYGNSLTYACDSQYATEDGQARKVSYCTANSTWEPPPPTCVRQRMATRDVCTSLLGRRIAGSHVASLRSRSKMDCVLRCMNNDRCFFCSFANRVAALPAGADNCRLYLGQLPEPDYVDDPDWDMYELGC